MIPMSALNLKLALGNSFVNGGCLMWSVDDALDRNAPKQCVSIALATRCPIIHHDPVSTVRCCGHRTKQLP